MTYTRKPRVFKLEFEEGTHFEGLSMSTRGLSIKEFTSVALKLGDIAGGMENASQTDQLAALPRLADALDEIREMFADALIEWNMKEEDGTPTPPTLDGVQLLDDQEFFLLINEWTTAIGGVSAPLGKGSTSGATSPELSALMEPLSPSQAS
jgi:hypothetical protein